MSLNWRYWNDRIGAMIRVMRIGDGARRTKMLVKEFIGNDADKLGIIILYVG